MLINGSDASLNIEVQGKEYRIRYLSTRVTEKGDFPANPAIADIAMMVEETGLSIADAWKLVNEADEKLYQSIRTKRGVE